MSRPVLATRVEGDGADAVLWIHGYTLDSSVWAPVWGELRNRRHVGIDLPGHGQSSPLDDRAGIHDVADAVVELGRVHAAKHLVAMSFGAIVALEAAITAPGAFRTLTLASPALAGGPEEPTAQTRNLALIRMYRERGPGPWLADLWMRSPPDIFTGAGAHPRLIAELREVVGRHRWTELGDDSVMRLGQADHRASRLAAIRARTLVLVGEEDMPSFARIAQLIRRAIDGSRVARVPGAGHLCVLERPQACGALIAAQLGREGGT
jgi:pimeloyl-ACP methyl ester carboxylesterase